MLIAGCIRHALCEKIFHPHVGEATSLLIDDCRFDVREKHLLLRFCSQDIAVSLGGQHRIAGFAMSVWACINVTDETQMHNFYEVISRYNAGGSGLCIFVRGLVLLCTVTNVLQANRMSNEEHVFGQRQGYTIPGTLLGQETGWERSAMSRSDGWLPRPQLVYLP